jgi:hypothetical protein
MPGEPEFIALDGESLAGAAGADLYCLLAASDERVIRARGGLSTRRCLDFIVDTAVAHEGAVLVAFGLDYDVNNWLRDAPAPALRALAKNGEAGFIVHGSGFYVSWAPGKVFTVTDRYRHRTARVFDVFGYFQGSFLDALDGWGLTPDGPLLAHMKGRRGTFTASDLPQLEAYCRTECRLLAELMGRLAAALARAGVARPRSWCGAGPLAQAILTQHNIGAVHEADPGAPPELAEIVPGAYYGGRVELCQMGSFLHAWHYDLNAAYAWAVAGLPPLAGATWERAPRYRKREPWAIWRAEWQLPLEASLCPLPYRDAGELYFPSNGSGWYWSSEIAAARAVFGDRVKVHGGWALHAPTGPPPFGFVHGLYAERLRMGAAGDPAAQVLKLGMAALYGKLAQSVGTRGRLPHLRSLVWAGMITAAVRAQVLRLAAVLPSAVISISTDGVTFESPIAPPCNGAPIGTGLGELSVSEWRDFFIVGNGLYSARSAGGETVRARGFFGRDVDWRALRRGWHDEGPFYVHESTSRRFVGLRSAGPEGAGWRTWRDVPSRLYFDPRPRKWPPAGITEGDWRGDHSLALYAPTVEAGAVSEGFRPRARFGGVPVDPHDDYAAGREQPLRDF